MPNFGCSKGHQWCEPERADGKYSGCHQCQQDERSRLFSLSENKRIMKEAFAEALEEYFAKNPGEKDV